jgi:hypothetical protein
MIGRINGSATMAPGRADFGHRFSGRAPVRGSHARSSVLQTDAQQSGALKVTTADGDTVSISFSARQQLQSLTYSGVGRHGSVEYSGSSASSSTTVAIRVDGSLDQSEIEDISKVMESLAQAVSRFRSGDPAGTVTALAGAGSLDSLQSVQLAYQENARLAGSSSRN